MLFGFLAWDHVEIRDVEKAEFLLSTERSRLQNWQFYCFELEFLSSEYPHAAVAIPAPSRAALEK